MAKQVVAFEITTDSKQAEASVGSFKKQLKEANNELLNMSSKFGEASAEAINAAKKVAGLKDAIGDAKALADTFNPDKKFVALGGALQGATAGFSALQGAMGLFGAEGKDVEQMMLKVQSAMALQQGISGIAGAMDSFKLLGNEVKGNVVKAFSTLKGAIIGTGIGLLVVGLGLLIANFDKVKEVVLKLIPGLGMVADFVGGVIQSITDFVGVTSEAERATERMVAAADESIARNKKYLQEHGDEVDKYTKRKIDAETSYNEAIKEKGADRIELAKRFNREIDAADKDRAKEVDDNLKSQLEKQRKINEEARQKREADRLKEEAIKDEELKKQNDQADAENKLFIKSLESDKTAEDIKAQNKITIKGIADASLIATTQKTSAELAQIDKAKNDEERKDAKALFDQRIALASESLTIIADVLGKESAAGKAIAISSALINTYLGISAGVKLGYPAAIPAVLAAAATGFKAVKSIIGTKIPGKASSSGGAGGGSMSAPSLSSSTAPITPQAQTTTLSAQSINQIGVASSRAYVLESDVSSNQERTQRLNRAARIN
jgi:hypothetical protein